MKLRKKISLETRMKSSFFMKCVWLIQLLPRGGAPPALRAVAPRWVLYVFMYGVVRQDAPTPMPRHGEHYPTKQKSGLRAAFLLLRKLYSSGKGYMGLMIPFLTSASRCSAYFFAPSKFSGGIGPPSGPSLKPIIFQLG